MTIPLHPHHNKTAKAELTSSPADGLFGRHCSRPRGCQLETRRRRQKTAWIKSYRSPLGRNRALKAPSGPNFATGYRRTQDLGVEVDGPSYSQEYFMNRNLRMDFDDSEEAGGEGGFDGIDEDLIWNHLQVHGTRTATCVTGER
ncbi:hypothetical protein TWF788_008512 [Orbilia oligospora]|uniref:Uncharacterized protein n=1 Tax=Orbilia oligospora TaxID=2813651 RepID=A0A7C8PEH4_ORBOL|nr:hypothetical protein TWF788_008512 [Orbilia oligospora]